MMKKRLPKVLSNPVSLTGLVIALFNIGFIVFLTVVEAMSSRQEEFPEDHQPAAADGQDRAYAGAAAEDALAFQHHRGDRLCRD